MRPAAWRAVVFRDEWLREAEAPAADRCDGPHRLVDRLDAHGTALVCLNNDAASVAPLTPLVRLSTPAALDLPQPTTTVVRRPGVAPSGGRMVTTVPTDADDAVPHGRDGRVDQASSNAECRNLAVVVRQ
jgi:hypothetical protein